MCEAYHYWQSTWLEMCTLMQMLQSGHANFFQWECSLQQELAYRARSKVPAADNVIEGSVWHVHATILLHISVQSLSGSMLSSYSRVTVNKWEQDLTFQAAQGYDEKEQEVIHMHRTVRPSHAFCYQLSNTKLLSASKSCSWGNLTTAARNVLSTSPFPPGTCESWHGGVRGRKQNAKRVCINNEAVCAWSCMVTS